MKKSKKGFTLIELIVVLAILAVIAAIAVPTAFGAITDAQIAADTATIESFNSAIRMQGAIIRASKDAVKDNIKNSFYTAMSNAKINIKDSKPQSNEEIFIIWVKPTDKTIGHFEVAKSGIKLDSSKYWMGMLTEAINASVGIGVGNDAIIA
ncbi:MAG: prepilin-type N-terminal cleavage/methylation domain-containing protein [Oscillospiraceae bacterium]